jgi:LmbE family N-acetylglucosaminyl deacetylase
MKPKILIIEPHSDDSFIAAGGFLIKNKDNYDFNFCLVVASDLKLHHKEVTKEERLNEYQAFVDYIGGKWDRTELPLDYESRLDMVSRSKLVGLIESKILEIKPDIIMTMGPSFHHDHTIVFEAVIAATRPTFNYAPKCIWVMENPTYVHKLRKSEIDDPNVYVELTEEMINEKERAFNNIFVSQIRPDGNYLSNQGMRNWARYRGIEARCEYAEAFYQYFQRI